MKKTYQYSSCLLVLFLIFFTVEMIGQVTIFIKQLPNETPANTIIYIAGNFNNWQPDQLQMHKNDKGQWFVTLPKVKYPIEYKFTRGSWGKVESDINGNAISNREIQEGKRKVFGVTIEGWEDLLGNQTKSTSLDNVLIYSDSFFFKKYNRYRRVWVYLPTDYKTSKKSYPVLYMHDGQNLFDRSTSYSGEWKVDETLSKLEKESGLELIIVGIDNGGQYRMDEYNPWVHKRYGGGQGNDYLDFIIKTLKTDIDAHFRTKKSAEHTGIMGSSMGGLISMYGIMKHSDVFGKAGVFSPSFWISKKSFEQVKANGDPSKMKIYLLMGGKEGTNMNKGMRKMTKVLQKKGFDDESLFALTVEEGKHHEEFWSKEFGQAVIWLFGE